MAQSRRPLDPGTKRKNLSRVSNGMALFHNVDARTALGRRYRDIVAAVVQDQGGQDHIAEARLQLCRRFAAAALLAEQMEAQLVSGEQIDIQEHALLCSSLVRIAMRLGIDRKAKDITPSLSQYLRQSYPAEEAAG